MNKKILKPRLDLLTQEYVLIQAWKKTASYIRSHNWYADTLELDYVAVNLPDFLSDLAEQLSSPEDWENDPLRIVFAPKSQRWKSVGGKWGPVDGVKATSKKLRPLAHVTIMDQVAATAIMLCLANRVETKQGDPRNPKQASDDNARVISYGNRLFCDKKNRRLQHRWGSTKLYRAYFQDYQSFISRPEEVAQIISSRSDKNTKTIIVHSDLKQFYDRVRPNVIALKLDALKRDSDDVQFFEFAKRLLNWEWHKSDVKEVNKYAAAMELPDFSHVALPQGLVSAGFFANIVLLDFDEALRKATDTELFDGVILHDACRYVDDIRLVLTTPKDLTLKYIGERIIKWLNALLAEQSDGLSVSDEKTKAVCFQDEERPLVRQSRKMKRIQKAISGGFDAIGGQEILDAVQGLVRSQARYSEERTTEDGWLLAPIPDVRDDTVARFAAARFRTTFRSLRPLLEEHEAPQETSGNAHTPRTREELDAEAQAYALGLIENWVEDPSNVRLLRIGLDIWPDATVLKAVLEILHQYTEKGGGRKAPRRVAWYCLGEIFRAGATETGFVENGELLSEGVDIDAYHEVLLKEAVRLASLPSQTLPWYLKQQVFLFLAGAGPERAPFEKRGGTEETSLYRYFIFFLRGEFRKLSDQGFVTFAILARRSFQDRQRTCTLLDGGITNNRLRLVAERDPSFFLELLEAHEDFIEDFIEDLPARIRHDFSLNPAKTPREWRTLDQCVLGESEFFRNEKTLLEFASKFLAQVKDINQEIIAPRDVLIQISEDGQSQKRLTAVKIHGNTIATKGSIYKPPRWCSENKRWRFQLGYLLRFILSKQRDFTKPVRKANWREGTIFYRVPESHWLQRVYGLYNGHSAFGDDWLPITDWTEQLLFALLSWPGCRPSRFWEWVSEGIDSARDHMNERIQLLQKLRGGMSDVRMLPLSAPWPQENKPSKDRPLRMCVVQTVIPTANCFGPGDLTLSSPPARRCHRNHLSAALAAVERMLDLRETHKGSDGRLDLLVLPELAVHPSDIDTHLVPFVRAHRAIVVAGLTYEELSPGQPLVNSALWLIPVWSEQQGLRVIRRRQGKQHLAPAEQSFNEQGERIAGFRPCQWIVGYEWNSVQPDDRPLNLSASICYDATDIRLAADLRDRSDVFLVPALNRDVNTFDNMALALHYHMFQMVVIANNGSFGGSNAYAPYKEAYVRQIFHMHGQPQASIAFLEIDDIGAYQNRSLPSAEEQSVPKKQSGWKQPPAGLLDR